MSPPDCKKPALAAMRLPRSRLPSSWPRKPAAGQRLHRPARRSGRGQDHAGAPPAARAGRARAHQKPHLCGGGTATSCRAWTIWHFDFYRFSDPREWEDAGFRDIFASPGLKLAEWPEKAAALHSLLRTWPSTLKHWTTSSRHVTLTGPHPARPAAAARPERMDPPPLHKDHAA